MSTEAAAPAEVTTVPESMAEMPAAESEVKG